MASRPSIVGRVPTRLVQFEHRIRPDHAASGFVVTRGAAASTRRVSPALLHDASATGHAPLHNLHPVVGANPPSGNPCTAFDQITQLHVSSYLAAPPLLRGGFHPPYGLDVDIATHVQIAMCVADSRRVSMCAANPTREGEPDASKYAGRASGNQAVNREVNTRHSATGTGTSAAGPAVRPMRFRCGCPPARRSSRGPRPARSRRRRVRCASTWLQRGRR